LAGHTFQHDLHFARINGVLGSIDANRGDPMLGWDTDQFPSDIYDTTLAMYEVVKNGGLHKGGLNFDAKVRRGSFEPVDLIYAHIQGMDTFAKGLRVAFKLYQDKAIESFVEQRYSSYNSGIGKDIADGKVGFAELEQYALSQQPITNQSGRQEYLETVLNNYIFEV
jgi:xylose isomerase